jgi:ubiquinone/menaquinone biosynthesis C-methylase UbiE
MTNTHQKQVLGQFDPVASAYLTSEAHARGEDLASAARWAGAFPTARVLDLGCGAGHLSFAVAPHVHALIAYDLSPGMLTLVAQTAAERGLRNIAVEKGAVESLPFDDAAFDLVCSRFSAHHWSDLPAALKEARRVLKPGGQLMMIDVAAPENPLIDTHLQAIELLRDPSHVRDYSPSEWRTALIAADLHPLETHAWPLRLGFDAWVTRMRTPQQNVDMIRVLLARAPQEVKAGLKLEGDCSFKVDVIGLCAVAGGR